MWRFRQETNCPRAPSIKAETSPNTNLRSADGCWAAHLFTCSPVCLCASARWGQPLRPVCPPSGPLISVNSSNGAAAAARGIMGDRVLRDARPSHVVSPPVVTSLPTDCRVFKFKYEEFLKSSEYFNIVNFLIKAGNIKHVSIATVWLFILVTCLQCGTFFTGVNPSW